MANKLAEKWATTSQIPMQDSFIPRSSTQNSRIPSNSTYSIRVTMHNTNTFHFIHVPDLDLSTIGS
jgi:hypothetical protein